MDVLELHVTFDLQHVAECAAALRGRLRPSHWKLLASLAAEVLLIHEQEAAGTRLVVCQTVEEAADLPEALRLPVARG